MNGGMGTWENGGMGTWENGRGVHGLQLVPLVSSVVPINQRISHSSVSTGG